MNPKRCQSAEFCGLWQPTETRRVRRAALHPCAQMATFPQATTWLQASESCVASLDCGQARQSVRGRMALDFHAFLGPRRRHPRERPTQSAAPEVSEAMACLVT